MTKFNYIPCQNTYLVGGISVTSFSVMFLISPVISILLLLFPTVYFLYNTNYKSILLIWGFFFFTWYFVFTACLIGYDYPISIGSVKCGTTSEETNRLFFYLFDNYSSLSPSSTWFSCIFETFCFQTFISLGLLSYKIGFPIYIPSVFKVIIALIKFLFGGGKPSAKCSPKKGFEEPSFKTDWPMTSEKSKSTPPKIDELIECAKMRAAMEKRWRGLDLLNVDQGVRGNKYIIYGQGGIPWFKKYSLCFSRDATSTEINKASK